MNIWLRLKSGTRVNLNHAESLQEDTRNRWQLRMISGKEHIIDNEEALRIMNMLKTEE